MFVKTKPNLEKIIMKTKPKNTLIYEIGENDPQLYVVEIPLKHFATGLYIPLTLEPSEVVNKFNHEKVHLKVTSFHTRDNNATDLYGNPYSSLISAFLGLSHNSLITFKMMSVENVVNYVSSAYGVYTLVHNQLLYDFITKNKKYSVNINSESYPCYEIHCKTHEDALELYELYEKVTGNAATVYNYNLDLIRRIIANNKANVVVANTNATKIHYSIYYAEDNWDYAYVDKLEQEINSFINCVDKRYKAKGNIIHRIPDAHSSIVGNMNSKVFIKIEFSIGNNKNAKKIDNFVRLKYNNVATDILVPSNIVEIPKGLLPLIRS